MPWRTNGNRRYFYKSIRVNGRVTRKYLGAGVLAHQVAADIERRRSERAAQRAALHADQEWHSGLLAPLEDLCGLTDLVMKATLIGAGFYQHDRTWRKRHATGCQN